MAYKKIAPYTPSTQIPIPGTERQALQEELKKIASIIRDLIAAIEELRSKVP